MAFQPEDAVVSLIYNSACTCLVIGINIGKVALHPTCDIWKIGFGVECSHTQTKNS